MSSSTILQADCQPHMKSTSTLLPSMQVPQYRGTRNSSKLSRMCRTMAVLGIRSTAQDTSNMVPRSCVYNVNYGISSSESKAREHPQLAKLTGSDIVQPSSQDILSIQTTQMKFARLRLSRREPLSPLRKPWGFGGAITPSLAARSPSLRRASGLLAQTASPCNKNGTKGRTGEGGEAVALGRGLGPRGRRKSDVRGARPTSSSLSTVSRQVIRPSFLIHANELK